MPFSAKHCISGVRCSVTKNPEPQDEDVPKPGPPSPISIDSTREDKRPFTYHGNRDSEIMYYNQYHDIMEPIPSELKLYQKARSLGLVEAPFESSARHVKPINDHTSPRLLRPDNLIQNSPSSENMGYGDYDNGYASPKSYVLPKIPVIKHPFQGSIPTVMRSDAASSQLPECITALSPRSKTFVDITKLESRLFVPPKAAPNQSSSPSSMKKTRSKNDQTTNSRSTRIIVSPNSKAFMKHRPEDYYNQRYPLVMLDDKLKQKSKTVVNPNETGPKGDFRSRHSLPAISNQDSSPQRLQRDLIPIEQVIGMSAARIRPLHLNVSGWLHEIRCKPKKLHTKTLHDNGRVPRKVSTFAK